MTGGYQLILRSKSSEEDEKKEKRFMIRKDNGHELDK